MYAVIRTGGKQYRVEAGQRLHVEKLPGDVGDHVDLSDVLMVGGSGDVAVGTPLVLDAKVVGEIVAQERSRKVTVFKYKNKTRYRKLHGHRQQLTQLAITEIRAPDGTNETYEVRRPAAEEVAVESEASVQSVPEAIEEASSAGEAPPEDETEDGPAGPDEAAVADAPRSEIEESPDAVAEEEPKAAKRASAAKKSAKKAAKKAPARNRKTEES